MSGGSGAPSVDQRPPPSTGPGRLHQWIELEQAATKLFERGICIMFNRQFFGSLEFFRIAIVVTALCVCACGSDKTERSMVVTVTAYNSVPSQTNSQPTVAAWGDTLKPGMKVVAVSRDLLDEGLSHGSVLRIEGFQGKYVVLDKTAARFTKRVDVYMGVDVEAAKEFGVKQLRISWRQ